MDEQQEIKILYSETNIRVDLAEARVNANNAAQTATLISTLRPYPTPAYTVSFPYESLTPSTTA